MERNEGWERSSFERFLTDAQCALASEIEWIESNDSSNYFQQNFIIPLKSNRPDFIGHLKDEQISV